MTRSSVQNEGPSIGDTIEVLWEEDGKWYRAHIPSFNNHGEANVNYDDGTCECGVARNRIRPFTTLTLQTQAMKRGDKEHECHLVFVVGHPGAGKSTLSSNVIGKIQERQGGVKMTAVKHSHAFAWLESSDKTVALLGRWRGYHARPSTKTDPKTGQLNGDDQNGQGADRIYPGP